MKATAAGRCGGRCARLVREARSARARLSLATIDARFCGQGCKDGKDAVERLEEFRLYLPGVEVAVLLDLVEAGAA